MRRNVRSAWKCPNCGKDCHPISHAKKMTSVFLGTVQEIYCPECDEEVTLLRGENGKFITLIRHVSLTEGVWPNVATFLSRRS